MGKKIFVTKFVNLIRNILIKVTHRLAANGVRAMETGNCKETSPSKILGRVWSVIAGILDEDVSSLVLSGKLVWLPAHCARTNVGQSRLSNGKRMTAIDWRANHLADILAKLDPA